MCQLSRVTGWQRTKQPSHAHKVGPTSLNVRRQLGSWWPREARAFLRLTPYMRCFRLDVGASRDRLRRSLAEQGDGAERQRAGQTHILEEGSNVGCHQQDSRALRGCQLPCHNSLRRRWVAGLARRTLKVRSGEKKHKKRRRRVCHGTGYETGDLPQTPGLRRLGWSIFFFSGGRASTGSRFAVEGPLAAAASSVLLLALLFHSHRRSFRFSPRRVPGGSGSFRQRVFPELLSSVKVSLREQDSVPGPLPSVFGEDRLEASAALTSARQWQRGAVLKGPRPVNTRGSGCSPAGSIIGHAAQGIKARLLCHSSFFV